MQYHVRATIVSAFDRDESILVSVQTTAAPSLPAAETLAGRFDLTPREAEVALLLADGRSNAEIAEQLFISPHTAKRHVEKALAKLEVSSRAKVLARLLDPATAGRAPGRPSARVMLRRTRALCQRRSTVPT